MTSPISWLRAPMLAVVVLTSIFSVAQREPGRLVRVGGVELQIHCTGGAGPTVVVETGLGDFLSDWVLVQQRVEKFARICTYDRGGYGSSQLADVPRTFAQLNLELHELLRASGEKPPFILVGHSFGGAVIRNYAARYPSEVAGMVLAESVAEHQPILIGGKPTLLKDFASGRAIPEPRLAGPKSVGAKPQESSPLEEGYGVLPAENRSLHQRFSAAASLEEAENGQREWSSEYFAEWDRHPQKGLLSDKPLVVLTRAESGESPRTNYSVEQADGQRLRAQTEQLALSSNSIQFVVRTGHNMHLEAPDAVSTAIRAVVTAARAHRNLLSLPIGR
jgi:pimeloyl-ACP methyl ester carboxylesterase